MIFIHDNARICVCIILYDNILVYETLAVGTVAVLFQCPLIGSTRKYKLFQIVAVTHCPTCKKGTFLYSAVSSPCDRSKRFTLHPPADMFIPRLSQLLFISTVCIARYSFIQLSELWQRGVINLAKGSKRPLWDLKPGSIESPAF